MLCLMMRLHAGAWGAGAPRAQQVGVEVSRLTTSSAHALLAELQLSMLCYGPYKHLVKRLCFVDVQKLASVFEGVTS